MTATVAVEDLPQMWERPSLPAILSALQTLEVKPPIWNHRRRRSDILVEQESLAMQHKAQAQRYISSIIGSPLSWLGSDEEREEAWSLASKRMAERCGRTAMGEVTRAWPFDDESAGEGGTPGDGSGFEIVIKEPALTGDSLGFKTWGSSYVLSRYLPQLRDTSLSKIFESTSRPSVLELGSGTGLLGIAAAALWGTSVVLSDLPNIVANLRDNANTNSKVVSDKGGSLKVGPLTWGGSGEEEIDPELFSTPHQFKIVLAADPLYDDAHPGLLASAIAKNLALDDGDDGENDGIPPARAVVMVPLRDETTKRFRDALKVAMLDLPSSMACDEENELAGQDDWVDDEEGGFVTCWLGVFSRQKGGANRKSR